MLKIFYKRLGVKTWNERVSCPSTHGVISPCRDEWMSGGVTVTHNDEWESCHVNESHATSPCLFITLLHSQTKFVVFGHF